VGPEFRVNTYTTHSQSWPSVSSNASGNFVVVWSSDYQDGSQFGIFGQRYDSGGNPLGGEFRVNTQTASFQVGPSVASDASGNFVVVWESSGQDGSVSGGIFGQRYDSDGNPLGGEFQVNTHTTFGQLDPSVASDESGNFVVVWASVGQDAGGYSVGIFGQRYDSGGNALGGEFQVNTYTTGEQSDPSVTSDAAGNVVVVWQSWAQFGGQDGSYSGIFGQRYDSSGNALGGEFQVNTYTARNQDVPSVASDASGNFVVVWQSDDQDGSNEGIFGQRYDSGGNPLGGEFQANTYTTDQQSLPSVASDASGNFVIVWESFGQDGSDWAVFGQRYDSDGSSLGAEFQVNTYTPDNQFSKSVASDANGNLVVVWQSWGGQDGHLSGIFGQRFSAACEASVQVKGDIHTPGSTLPVRIRIAHNRPETVTVPWELSLIDPEGRVVAERVTPPHTFEPGDVVDKDLALMLPEDLEGGTYTLRLGISGMAGIEAATTSFQVVRSE
jgi:hypothetical protein